MKAVLLSIKPKYCELIASGKKTIEVRKTRPKIDTPFKCYIYCTYGNTKENYCLGKRGKVIGEFVCKEIEPLTEDELFYGMDEISNSRIEEISYVDIDKLLSYKGKNDLLYGWHITDLKIYGNPKELSEFYPYAPKYTVKDGSKYNRVLANSLKRPPNSWCYVENLGE